MRSKLLLIFACLLIWTPNNTRAQFQQTSGPEGGVIEAIIDHEGTLLAGTFGSGIYRSVDSGNSWVQSNDGLLNLRVWCFAQMDTLILAGTSEGVFKSINNGNSWAPTGLTTEVLSIMICENYIFAGSTFNGIYRSDDFGNNWVLKNNGLTNLFVTSTACYDSILYTGTQGGVFVSTNFGNNWTFTSMGYPVNELAVFQSTLFAGVEGYSGLYKTEAGSNTWSFSGNGMNWYESVGAIERIDGVLYAGTLINGVFRSINNGNSWAMINAGLSEKHILSLECQGSILLTGTQGGGVYAFNSSGNTWTSSNKGLINTLVHSFVTTGPTLFAGTDFNGIHTTCDQGENWEHTGLGLPTSPVYSLMESEQSLFCGLGNASGIYRSGDQGLTWTTCGVSRNVYALKACAGNLFAGTNNGIYISTDGGNVWVPCGTGLPVWTSVLSLLDYGNLIFAGLSGKGVYISQDQGNTWVARNNGMAPGLLVKSMVKNDSTLFAGTNSGVYRSTDLGEHWDLVVSGLSSLSINVLSNAADGILAGTSNGLFFTRDNGDHWTNVGDGLTDKDIQSVAVNDDIVYAGSGYSGVWKNYLWVITGIHENKKTDSFICYPIPARNTLTIRSKIPGKGMQAIMIYDLKGECVHKFQPKNIYNPVILNISHLLPGHYVLQVRESEIIQREHFIVGE